MGCTDLKRILVLQFGTDFGDDTVLDQEVAALKVPARLRVGYFCVVELNFHFHHFNNESSIKRQISPKIRK